MTASADLMCRTCEKGPFASKSNRDRHERQSCKKPQEAHSEVTTTETRPTDVPRAAAATDAMQLANKFLQDLAESLEVVRVRLNHDESHTPTEDEISATQFEEYRSADLSSLLHAPYIYRGAAERDLRTHPRGGYVATCPLDRKQASHHVSFATKTVAAGGGSRFISHSKCALVALWFNPRHVFRVMQTLICGRTFNLTQASMGLTATNFAADAREVLVEGFVPQAAAVLINLLDVLSWSAIYSECVAKAHVAGEKKQLRPSS